MRIFLFYLKSLFGEKKISLFIIGIMSIILLLADVLMAEILNLGGFDAETPAKKSYTFFVESNVDNMDEIAEYATKLTKLKDVSVVETRKLADLPEPIDIICYLTPIAKERDYSGTADLNISDNNIGYHFMPGYDIVGKKIVDKVITESYIVDSDMHVQDSYSSKSVGFIYCNPNDYKVLAEKIDRISLYFENKLSDYEFETVKSNIEGICGSSIVVKPEREMNISAAFLKKYGPVYLLLILIIVWNEMEVVFHLLDANSIQINVYRLCGAEQDLLIAIEVMAIVVFEFVSFVPGTLLYCITLKSGEVLRSFVNPLLISLVNLAVLLFVSIFVFVLRKLFVMKRSLL